MICAIEGSNSLDQNLRKLAGNQDVIFAEMSWHHELNVNLVIVTLLEGRGLVCFIIYPQHVEHCLAYTRVQYIFTEGRSEFKCLIPNIIFIYFMPLLMKEVFLK